MSSNDDEMSYDTYLFKLEKSIENIREEITNLQIQIATGVNYNEHVELQQQLDEQDEFLHFALIEKQNILHSLAPYINTIQCSICHSEISENEQVCPYCGNQIK
jgi:hypothetical protein